MRAVPARPGWCLRAAALLFVAPAILCAQVTILGRAIDENGASVAGARVEFRSEAHAIIARANSDNQGRFQVELPAAGAYMIHAEKEGFYVLEAIPVAVGGDGSEVTVTLNHLREFVESIDVKYSPPVIDPAATSEQKKLNSIEILEIPYPASQDLRNALPLFSGVVQDNEGRFHVNGGGTEQTNVTLDGFNISDPVTGRFDARLSIDAVRSLDLESSRFSVDRGRGSAGSLDVKTGMGDDRWRFGATNFLPGVSAKRGIFINKWTPRVTVSGPVARGRAWFHNGFDAFYDVDTIEELPPGENRSRSLTTSNLTRFHLNLNPANILTGSYLLNYTDDNRKGLSFLNPAETTMHRRQNFSMATIKEQMYLSRGALLEFGFAYTQATRRDSPQGAQTYEISPVGHRGNYFVDLSRRTDRQQWIVNAFFPAWDAAGEHEFKAGIDLQRSGFDETVVRHDYVVLRTDGSRARHVSFAGNGDRRRTNFETALFVMDRWSLREGLLLELGLRADWDQILRQPLAAPRAAIAWAPGWLGSTKISAGVGTFADVVSLDLLTRHQGQRSVAVFYSRGGDIVLGPVETAFQADEHSLRVPRARVWSFTVERKLPLGLYGRAGYLRRRGVEGLTFVDPRPATSGSTVLYSLGNDRSDRYDALEFTVQRTFAGRYEWVAGYTHSKARSNAVVDYSLEEPFFAKQSPGPVAWDTPHRFLTWGWAPFPVRFIPPGLRFLFHDTSVTYLMESRNGFPFSVVNEEGNLVGRPNERRFPSYFNVNLHLERRFRFMHYQWAWRFGLYNLTNHGNPNVVNNNIDSPLFLTYERGQRRAFNVRLRFLGRR